MNPSHALSYSAKSNAAFSRGNIAAMMKYKEQAISCAPYSVAEYCDYFEKLYIAMQMYTQAGDTASASFCQKKLHSIPDMMHKVALGTSSLAHLTDNDMRMELPENYKSILEKLPVS